MPLNTQDSDTLLQRMAAAVQSGATQVINLTVGTILRAFLEATRDIAMWLQSLVMQLMTASRLSTATGADVDSFIADFGLTRLAAISSIGAVTFARTTTTQPATVPAGTQIQTADGTQTFLVIADTSQTAWNATLNAYTIAIGAASITATVQAINAGTQGNILANTLTTLKSPIQGVQTVNNALAYTNGVDAETDAAVKVRFALYVSGIRAGIKAAVASAIANLQQGIQQTTVENTTYGGLTQNGYFYVVVNPYTSAIQTAVYSAVDAIRPLGVTFGVFAATTITANVVMTATPKTGYTHTQIAADITTAIQAYIAGLGLGVPLYWSQLYAIAYGVAGVLEVSALTLNGGTTDISTTAQQVVTVGTVSVS